MLLALDTATATASLALYDRDAHRLLVEETWQARRRHTQELVPTAQQLLRKVGAEAGALTALAVTTGPGSFTGVRVGISTIKGMALGLRTPPLVVGVPTLTVVAAPWLAAAWSTSPLTIVCAYVQAGRGRYNWCWFGPEDLLFRPAAEDHHAGDAATFAAALAAHGAASIWLAGEPDALLAEAVASLPHVTLLDAVSTLRRAGQLARLAELYFDEGIVDDVATLQPLYLRAP
jgi:tRNA threonylcarbamoyladenosine biosynthesis protein TsaB